MLQRIPEFLGNSTQFWLGFVESRNDPLQLGRVRVRIIGYHTEDVNLIPTEFLPWAIVVNPANTASLSGVGTSPNGLMIGSMVIGIFMDGRDCQMPAVLGSINQIEGLPNNSEGIINLEQNRIQDDQFGVPGNFTPNGDGPPWTQVARSEIGVKEGKGAQNNPKIQEYLASAGLGRQDSIPWCSAFQIWCLKKAGHSTSGLNGMAKSFLSASSMEKLSKPINGCFVVFNRPPNPSSGHVTQYVGTKGGRILGLGGNQGDAVTIAGYSMNRVAGFVWPKGANKNLADFENTDQITSTSDKVS